MDASHHFPLNFISRNLPPKASRIGPHCPTFDFQSMPSVGPGIFVLGPKSALNWPYGFKPLGAPLILFFLKDQIYFRMQ